MGTSLLMASGVFADFFFKDTKELFYKEGIFAGLLTTLIKCIFVGIPIIFGNLALAAANFIEIGA